MKPKNVRVRAQRKFAQGAYIPPTNPSTTDRRRENLHKDDTSAGIANVVHKNMISTSAKSLLDIVSFNNIHTHDQPVVLLERLSTPDISNNEKRLNKETLTETNNNNDDNSLLVEVPNKFRANPKVYTLPKKQTTIHGSSLASLPKTTKARVEKRKIPRRDNSNYSDKLRRRTTTQQNRDIPRPSPQPQAAVASTNFDSNRQRTGRPVQVKKCLQQNCRPHTPRNTRRSLANLKQTRSVVKDKSVVEPRLRPRSKAPEPKKRKTIGHTTSGDFSVEDHQPLTYFTSNDTGNTRVVTRDKTPKTSTLRKNTRSTATSNTQVYEFNDEDPNHVVTPYNSKQARSTTSVVDTEHGHASTAVPTSSNTALPQPEPSAIILPTTTSATTTTQTTNESPSVPSTTSALSMFTSPTTNAIDTTTNNESQLSVFARYPEEMLASMGQLNLSIISPSTPTAHTLYTIPMIPVPTAVYENHIKKLTQASSSDRGLNNVSDKTGQCSKASNNVNKTTAPPKTPKKGSNTKGQPRKKDPKSNKKPTENKNSPPKKPSRIAPKPGPSTVIAVPDRNIPLYSIPVPANNNFAVPSSSLGINMATITPIILTRPAYPSASNLNIETNVITQSSNTETVANSIVPDQQLTSLANSVCDGPDTTTDRLHSGDLEYTDDSTISPGSSLTMLDHVERFAVHNTGRKRLVASTPNISVDIPIVDNAQQDNQTEAAIPTEKQNLNERSLHVSVDGREFDVELDEHLTDETTMTNGTTNFTQNVIENSPTEDQTMGIISKVVSLSQNEPYCQASANKTVRKDSLYQTDLTPTFVDPTFVDLTLDDEEVQKSNAASLDITINENSKTLDETVVSCTRAHEADHVNDQSDPATESVLQIPRESDGQQNNNCLTNTVVDEPQPSTSSGHTSNSAQERHRHKGSNKRDRAHSTDSDIVYVDTQYGLGNAVAKENFDTSSPSDNSDDDGDTETTGKKQRHSSNLNKTGAVRNRESAKSSKTSGNIASNDKTTLSSNDDMAALLKRQNIHNHKTKLTRCNTQIDNIIKQIPDIMDPPVFHPTLEEFKDPIPYLEKIMVESSKFGLCKVVPPEGFTPSCNTNDEMRFKVSNQYIGRMYSRWGSAQREIAAIKSYSASQSVPFIRAPLLDCMEIDVSKLYQTVQYNGGLKEVIEKKLWNNVEQQLCYSETPKHTKKLDVIYVKYLLPYHTLSANERQSKLRAVEERWRKKNLKLLNRAKNPLHRQKKLLGESDSSTDDDDEDCDDAVALTESEDCVVSGRNMNLAMFKRIAANVKETVRMNDWVNSNEESEPPSFTVDDAERCYWSTAVGRTDHVCVNTASIDTGTDGYGFSKHKNDAFGRHPWNLKMLSQNPGNVLRSLGSVLGVTVPTLHVAMMHSTCCWHRDPHGLPWIEYMHTGPGKIWYGIPNDQSEKFRAAVQSLNPASCQNKSIWLPSDIAMLPPNLLREHGVSLSRTVQNPGEFVIVFPKAYSSSIATGFTISESVYFATNSWLDSVHQVFQELRESCEPTMFSVEQLLVSIARDPRSTERCLHLVWMNLSPIVKDEMKYRDQLLKKGVRLADDESAARNQNRKRQAGAWNVREQDECEICRTTLYFSKVVGITSKRSAVCLLHAIELIRTEDFFDSNPSQYEMVLYFTNRELNDLLSSIQDRLLEDIEPE